VPGNGWYVATWRVSAAPYVSQTSNIQLQSRFRLTDSDLVTDDLPFHSGNASAAKRPILQVHYLP
jgi:hypothetical protein